MTAFWKVGISTAILLACGLTILQMHRHLDNLLTYLEHRITNAVTEGLNSKI